MAISGWTGEAARPRDPAEIVELTTHRCLTRLRRERWRPLITLQYFREPELTADLDARIEARSELARALGELDALPPKERVAFAMHHLDGKGLLEIGALLGHSKGYVSKLIQRAEVKIGGHLADLALVSGEVLWLRNGSIPNTGQVTEASIRATVR